MNEKQVRPILAAIAVAALLSTSCGTSRFTPKQIHVRTLPDACLFLNLPENSLSDGFHVQTGAHEKLGGTVEYDRFVGRADGDGNALVCCSEAVFRKSSKKLLIAKSGFEPTEFKIRKRFRGRVLWNVFFPPALLWGRYTAIDERKTNEMTALPVAKASGESLYREAGRRTGAKRKAALLRDAWLHDVDNTQGIALRATGDLAALALDRKDYHAAYLHLTAAQRMDAECENLRTTEQLLRREIASQNEKYARRARNREIWTTALTGVANALNAPASLTAAPQSAPAAAPSKKSKSTRNYDRKSNSRVVVETQGRAIADRNYGGYVSQLVSMKFGTQAVDHAQRKRIQEEMRRIRLEAQQQGWRIPKSEMEDWDGRRD